MVGKMISLQSYPDNTGCLVPIEYPETIPFEAGRFFISQMSLEKLKEVSMLQ